IVLQLVAARMLEAEDLAALRVDARHHVLDHTILARRVHRLKDQQDGKAVGCVEQLLQRAQLRDVLRQDLPIYKSKEHYREILAEHVAQLSALQELLYATDRFAVLLIFQAMDAAGKDGVIEHVMSGVNPQGCQVFSFKHPSSYELQHDFLWRTTRDLPARGRIGIFNRSYYEEVLVV